MQKTINAQLKQKS